MNATFHAPAPPPHADAPPPTDTGRDRQGRFTKGNPGGPGNPFYRRQAELKRQLLAQVTDADVQSVMIVLLGLARSGDLAAIKLFLAYTVGKPGREVDPDQEEQHEWQLQQQTPRLEQVLEVASAGIEPARANQVTRELVDIVGDCQLRTLRQQLQANAERAENPPPPAPAETPPAPDANGRNRPGASARRMAAGIPPTVQTEDNGAAPDLDALLADVVQAAKAVDNGPEGTPGWWQNDEPGTDPPAGLASR
jgi:hypothetical protein